MTNEQEKRLEEIRQMSEQHHDEVLGCCGDELLMAIDEQRGEIEQSQKERGAWKLAANEYKSQLTAKDEEIKKLTKIVEKVK